MGQSGRGTGYAFKAMRSQGGAQSARLGSSLCGLVGTGVGLVPIGRPTAGWAGTVQAREAPIQVMGGALIQVVHPDLEGGPDRGGGGPDPGKGALIQGTWGPKTRQGWRRSFQ